MRRISIPQFTFLSLAALAALMLAGCPAGEAASDFSEVLGLSIFDDADEPGDIDDEDDAGDDDADDDAAAVPATVPDFAAASFSNPTQITNVYLPLVVGASRTYAADTPDGPERIVVEVLADTRLVSGVLCRVVRDRVFLNDVLIEDTHDFYAQDDAGNVWYMGETVDNHNYDDEGNLIDVTHEGAWEAGEDVAGIGTAALPGFAMPAVRTVGRVYNQEYYPGEAEDTGEIISLNATVTLASGATYDCVQTRDSTPLDPDAVEFKFYAAGVGLVLESGPDGSQRVELVTAN
jgi:hypothetical protein